MYRYSKTLLVPAAIWLVSLLPGRVTPQCSVRSLPTNEITKIRSSIGPIAHNWNCKNTVISHTHYNSFRTGYLQYFFSTVLYVSIKFPSDCLQKNCHSFSCNSKILKVPISSHLSDGTTLSSLTTKATVHSRHTALDYVAAKHVSQYIMIVIAVTIRMVITPKVAARALYMSAQRESRCASSKSPGKIQNTILILVQNFLLFFMFH